MLSHIDELKQKYDNALHAVTHCPIGGDIEKAISSFKEIAREYDETENEGE